jgi:membrane peptidoglycan carboxypeptidase
MTQVVKAGTGTAANLGARPVAGKTGTNNDSKDAWFVGYTPQLATAVGMYREVPINPETKAEYKVSPKTGQPLTKKKWIMAEKPLPGEIGGGGLPTQIWHDFMARALAKEKIEAFPERANLGVPENLVPSPTPTPKPEETEEPDFPVDEEEPWPPTEEEPNPEDSPDVGDGMEECAEWDMSCNGQGDNLDDGNDVFSDNHGTGQDREVRPNTRPDVRPSGRDPRDG